MFAKAVTALALAAVHISGRDAPAETVQPEMVVPGEWLTDKAEKYMFLPFTTPAGITVEHCKLMSNGEQLLVVVTESPKEEPETNALKKYKLVLEALKAEAGSDEDVLTSKLQTWLQTEDDEEVQVHIAAALDSLKAVMETKKDTRKRTLTLRLGLASKQQNISQTKGASFLSTGVKPHAISTIENTTQAEEQDAEHALTSIHRMTKKGGGNLGVGIIKESFAVEIPYPIDVERIFVIKVDETTIIAGMPLDRHSLEAKGISTGGKPFVRVPVFNPTGQRLAGPFAVLKHLASGLHLPSVVVSNLKALS